VVNFFIYLPKINAKIIRGMIPPKVMPVSDGEKIIRIINVQIMKMKERTNMLIDVDRQS